MSTTPPPKKEIRGRLWEHLNPQRGNKRTIIENNISTKAIFTAKDWDSRTYVPQQIRDAIVLGKFVAYSIRIDSIADQPNLVINLESFLIESYRLANGERPIFNLRS